MKIEECLVYAVWLLQEPHSVTSQKTPFFIVTAVKTSSLTGRKFFREPFQTLKAVRLESHFTVRAVAQILCQIHARLQPYVLYNFTVLLNDSSKTYEAILLAQHSCMGTELCPMLSNIS
jgi:hypothetical protein